MKKILDVNRNIDKELDELKKIIISKESLEVKYEAIKAILYELSNEVSKAKLAAMTESLTGFWGPKAIQKYIQKEIERSRRSKKDFCVAFIDIDFLKYINDNFGHVIGTKIIIEISKVIKKEIRKSDIVSRYGGDEFLLLFPDTGLEKTDLIIQRIRKKCEMIKINQKVKASVSVGAAEFNAQISNLENLLDAADKKLYQAKQKRINVNI